MSVSVVAPAATSALTTVASVRADLGLPAASPPNDQVQRFIDQASARAASFCRRTFGRETVRERFDGRGFALANMSGRILLDRSPVVRIVSVVADGVTVDPTAYEADERFLYAIRAGDRSPWAARRIVIDYEAGWLLPGEVRGDPAVTDALDLPSDIEAAVIQLVGVAVSASGRDATVKSESVDGIGSTSWYVQGASAALPHPEAEATLAQYRRLMFA